MKKFRAELVNYQIKDMTQGVVAKVVLEVPTLEIPKTYFLGGLIASDIEICIDPNSARNQERFTDIIEETANTTTE